MSCRLIIFAGLFVAFMAMGNGYGQAPSRVYQISGRVVDAQGRPVEGAEVCISRFYPRSSRVFDLLEESTVTDARGVFSISKPSGAGETIYVYTSLSAPGEYLISPPFSFANGRDKRLLGRRLKLREDTKIDLGDLPVQFYFGDLKLKVTKGRRALSESDWKTLWIVLSNDRKDVLYQQSIGPTIQQTEIDIANSTANYALPEGKYRIEFRTFDEEKVPLSIGRRALGATRLFTIRRNQTIDLTVDLRLK